MASNKIIALFVEGPTEIEFYKAVVKYVHDLLQTKFDCSFQWVDMHGIGNYKEIALRKFKYLKKKYPEDNIYAILCIDTDAFEYPLAKKPPFNKAVVKESLLDAGAKKVHYIEAKHSIEDWFLSDFDGVVSYLKLPKKTKKPSGKGQDILKSLFISKNKVYVKGGKTEGFIKKLNIEKIMSIHCKSIKPLCQTIGIDCKKICKKN